MAKVNTAHNKRTEAAPLRVVDAGGKDVKAETLDKLIHERVRLAITSALAVNPSLSFTELKKLLGTTDGNLSVHTQKLEEAGYVDCEKSFEGRRPKTVFKITRQGRKALDQYLAHMEAIISAVKKG